MMMHSRRRLQRCRRFGFPSYSVDVTYRLILFFHSMKRQKRKEEDKMPMKTKDMLSNNHSSLHFYYHVYNKISLEEEKYPSTLVRCNMSNIFFISSRLLFNLYHHIVLWSMIMTLDIDDNIS